MIPRVIANGMASLGNMSDKPRIALSEIAYHEKSCTGIMSFQDIKELWRGIGVGPVVKC